MRKDNEGQSNNISQNKKRKKENECDTSNTTSMLVTSANTTTNKKRKLIDLNLEIEEEDILRNTDGHLVPRMGWLVHPRGTMRSWCAEMDTEQKSRCNVCRRYYKYMEDPETRKHPMTSCKKKPEELKKRRTPKKKKINESESSEEIDDSIPNSTEQYDIFESEEFSD